MFIGLTSLATSDPTTLESSLSLLERINQWIYYSNLLIHATITHQMFGLGIVRNDKLVRMAPMVIDNAPLALILHIGLVGLAIVGLLLFQMWLYLRRRAISTRPPFVIAAASLWATLICAGSFNIIFSSFGAVFALVMLCDTRRSLTRDQGSTRELSTA
jgi:hypothetical protein